MSRTPARSPTSRRSSAARLTTRSPSTTQLSNGIDRSWRRYRQPDAGLGCELGHDLERREHPRRLGCRHHHARGDRLERDDRSLLRLRQAHARQLRQRGDDHERRDARGRQRCRYHHARLGLQHRRQHRPRCRQRQPDAGQRSPTRARLPTSRRSSVAAATTRITVATALSKGSIDLDGGTDKVTLSSAANVVTISNVESIVGGSGNDTVTLGSELGHRQPRPELRLRQADAWRLRQLRLGDQRRDAGWRHG